MSTDPTLAPALTDEQIDVNLKIIRDCAASLTRAVSAPGLVDRTIAAVIARAKREERELIAARLETWAEGHKKSGNTEHFAALHFASFMVHHDETNWPSTGATR